MMLVVIIRIINFTTFSHPFKPKQLTLLHGDGTIKLPSGVTMSFQAEHLFTSHILYGYHRITNKILVQSLELRKHLDLSTSVSMV